MTQNTEIFDQPSCSLIANPAVKLEEVSIMDLQTMFRDKVADSIQNALCFLKEVEKQAKSKEEQLMYETTKYIDADPDGLDVLVNNLDLTLPQYHFRTIAEWASLARSALTRRLPH